MGGITQLRFSSVGSSVSYDSDAQSYFTAAGITDTNEKDAWNTFVLGAKSDGFWTNISYIYPFLGSTSSTCAYSAKGVMTLTFFNSPTFDSNGIKGNGTNSYASTGAFSPSSFWIPSSISFGAYVKNSWGAGSVIIGGGNTYLYYDSSNFIGGVVGDNEAYGAVSDVTGFFVVTVPSTNLVEVYHNGIFEFDATSTIALDAPVIDFLRFSAGSYTAAQLGIAFIGTGLTSTKVGQMNNRVDVLMTSLGRHA